MSIISFLKSITGFSHSSSRSEKLIYCPICKVGVVRTFKFKPTGDVIKLCDDDDCDSFWFENQNITNDRPHKLTKYLSQKNLPYNYENDFERIS